MILKHIALINDDFKVTALSQMQKGSNADNIKYNYAYNFASFEKNSIDVDNPRPFIYAGSPLALSSANRSVDDCTFLTPVSFSVQFTKAVNFIGTTINTDVLIEDIKIELYTADICVKQLEFGESNNNFYEINAENVNKVVFYINKINKPGVFLDIFGVSFGKIVCWDESNIKDIKMVNNFSNVGRDLAIDTLNFTIPNLTDKIAFEESQRLEVLDDNGVCNYTFYLKSFKYNDDKTKVELEYADIIDVLDRETFYGGFYDDDLYGKTYYENVEKGNVERIVNEITNGYACDIAPEIKTLTVKGYMPVVSKRNALIYIANATGCKIIKHPNLQLVSQNSEIKKSFDDSNVFLGSIQRTSVKPSKQVNFTSLVYYTKELQDPVTTLKSNTVPYEKNKTYIFQFSEPMVEKNVQFNPIGTTESGAIKDFCNYYKINANHIEINSKYDFYINATLNFQLKNYTTSKAYQIDNAALYSDYETQNIDSFTLVDETNKDNIAENLLDYYSRQETITFKALWDKPSFNGLIDFYGEKKRVKKITTSFGDVVELEVE